LKKIRIISLLWGYRSGGVTECVKNYARLPRSGSIDMKTVIIQREGWGDDFRDLEGTDFIIIWFRSRYSFSWLRDLVKLIKKESPDILFAHAFNGTIIAFLVRMLYRGKMLLVCSYHGLYVAPSRSKKPAGWLYNALPLLINRKIADGVVCVSAFSKQELTSQGIPERKIRVVYNGIRPDPVVIAGPGDPAVRFPDDRAVIGYVGRLVPMKGIEVLIKVVCGIPGVRFLIVGDGPLADELKKEAVAAGERILFAGNQSNVDEWLKCMDIFVLPSFVENHSVSILEAMRSGKAIIATSVGGNPESVRDRVDGLIVPPGNADALASAIRLLVSEPELAKQLGANAREHFLESFTEERMHQNLTDYFTVLYNQKA